MNKRLNDAVSLISELPEERQEAAADLLLNFLTTDNEDVQLSPEQLAELEVALTENDYASEEEVETFFARFKK
jgi:hypothetical protein